MNRLEVLSDAVTRMAVLLHDHGPGCVCPPCTACHQAAALLPRLDHLLQVLDGWSRGEAEEPFTAEDIGMALSLLEDGSALRRTPEPAP